MMMDEASSAGKRKSAKGAATVDQAVFFSIMDCSTWY